MSLPELQAQVAAWHRRQFPECPREWLGLKLAEEAGEVGRAIVSSASGVRGGPAVWDRQIAVEAADVLNVLLALADRVGFDLEQVWRDRWAEVGRRDRWAEQAAMVRGPT